MFEKQKFVLHMLKFAADPTDTKEVFRFTDALFHSASQEERHRFGAALLADPRAVELLSSGNPDYLNKPFDLVTLRGYPAGSLGERYAGFMDERQLTPEFFAYNKVEDDASFFIRRLRKTHDVYHVLTGFATDVPGEIGLQAFYLGQMHVPSPMAIMVSAMLWIIRQRDGELIKRTMELVMYGYHLGRNSEKLHGVAWEHLWQVNLADLRDELNISPVPRDLLVAA